MNTESFLLRQAKLTGEVAARVLYPAEPFEAGEPFGVSAELYRQAIHWGLAAYASAFAEEGQKQSPANGAPRGKLPQLDELLSATPNTRLRSWARDDAHLERCVHHLRLVDYTYNGTQNEPEQRQACEDLRSFFHALLSTLAPTERAASVAALKRNLRVTAISGLVLALIVGSFQGMRSYKLRKDLALDATWSASSSFNPALECRSSEQECSQAKGFFFHTRQENNPWLMLDLKKDRKFSSVEVVNRKDCCQERANPLTVSVSKDGKEWRVVAERKTDFKTFSSQFPEVSARYVKIEIPKSAAMLHLERVRVFP